MDFTRRFRTDKVTLPTKRSSVSVSTHVALATRYDSLCAPVAALRCAALLLLPYLFVCIGAGAPRSKHTSCTGAVRVVLRRLLAGSVSESTDRSVGLSMLRIIVGKESEAGSSDVPSTQRFEAPLLPPHRTA